MTQVAINEVLQDIILIESVYRKLLAILPSFEIANSQLLPYGLKPHTRSVSWIVEQAINQQTKYNKEILEVSEVNFELPDTCLHDCELTINDRKYFVNIKIHNMAGKSTRNDISAVEKLFVQYRDNPEYNLLYVCIGIHFDERVIKFDPEYLNIFSPQFLPIYVNPRNDKIQAMYHHQPIQRSRKDFLKLLAENSRSISLLNSDE